ncbi:MAG: hypothetical protein KH156_13805, partial [Alistipes sp.]|nr:hypothetical protein [Alistipes sp.]
RNILKKYGIEDAEGFYKFIERDDVTGCDWIRFFLVQRKEQRASNRRTGSSTDAAGRAAGY